MELRRKHGFRDLKRAPWPTGTTRGGMGYPVAHACFGCRKSFKMDVGYFVHRPAKCPQCEQPLAWMGRTFKAPRIDDLKQWKKVEALWNAGVRFQSYRGTERLPETLSETTPFLQRLQAERLRRFRNAHRADAD